MCGCGEGEHLEEALADFDARLGLLLALHRQAHEVRAGVGAALDLGDGALDVTGIARCHRLQRNLVLAADVDIAHLHVRTTLRSDLLHGWSCWRGVRQGGDGEHLDGPSGAALCAIDVLAVPRHDQVRRGLLGDLLHRRLHRRRRILRCVRKALCLPNAWPRRSRAQQQRARKTATSQHMPNMRRAGDDRRSASASAARDTHDRAAKMRPLQSPPSSSAPAPSASRARLDARHWRAGHLRTPGA